MLCVLVHRFGFCWSMWIYLFAIRPLTDVFDEQKPSRERGPFVFNN